MGVDLKVLEGQGLALGVCCGGRGVFIGPLGKCVRARVGLQGNLWGEALDPQL